MTRRATGIVTKREGTGLTVGLGTRMRAIAAEWDIDLPPEYPAGVIDDA